MRRLAAIFLSLAASAAHAQSGGQVCVISATPLVFGAYRPMATSPEDFDATLTIDCTATSSNVVAVRATIALTGSPDGRRLNSGGHILRYQLYADAGRAAPWGDIGGTTVALSGFVGRATPFHRTVIVYGRLLAHQSGATVGNYTDMITAVLTY